MNHCLGLAACALVVACADPTPTADAVGPVDAFETADVVDAADVGGDVAPEVAVGPPAPDGAVEVTVAGNASVAETDTRFLSVALDTSQVVGGFWWTPGAGTVGGKGEERVPPFDFSNGRLRVMAAALAPALLRIGGTEADVVYVDLSDAPLAEAPAPYEFVLNKAMVDGLGGFASDMGYDLLFTLNAGPGTRDPATKAWQDDQARALMTYMTGQSYPVAVWELGNEVVGYGAIHGIEWNLTAAEYASDIGTLQALVDEVDPGRWIAGPSSPYWPTAGEFPVPFMPEVLAAVDPAHLDIVTWHYYPSQSERCFQVVPATAELWLEASAYDELDSIAAAVESPAAANVPNAQLWLGESGNAQCGGQAEVSNRFAGAMWWIDELGKVARRGHRVAVRQTLAGSEYGLIDEYTWDPNPGYWASVLWKRLMGTRVLGVTGAATQAEPVRTYAHCRADGAPGVAVAVVHHEETETRAVKLAGLADGAFRVWMLTAEALEAPTVALNGTTLTLPEGATALPVLEGEARNGEVWLEMPPLSIAFVRTDEAVAGCEP